jgi:hypothetical protein
MKTRNSFFWLSLVAAFALLAAGCSGDSALTNSGDGDIGGTNNMENVDLNASYGGLEFTDESEGFGDTSLMSDALMAEDSSLAVADEDSLVEDDPTLDRPEIRRTYVRILWGQLDGMPEDSVRTTLAPEMRMDWTGSVSVSEGAIALTRVIRFERPIDHRLPRTDRQSVGWVSHTGPHFDGILVSIFSRPDSNGVIGGELTFRTGPLTQSFSIAELNGLDQVVPVDDLGNAVSFASRVVDHRVDCGEGFLAGHWRNTPDRDDGNGGVFRGLVLNARNHPIGFLMGRYGINDAGERVFAGKFIARNGRIRGLVEGSWEPRGDEPGMGTFAGHWALRNGDRVGGLRGEYKSLGEGGQGFFHGQWAEACAEGI